MPELEQEHGSLMRQKVKNEFELVDLEKAMLKVCRMGLSQGMGHAVGRSGYRSPCRLTKTCFSVCIARHLSPKISMNHVLPYHRRPSL